MRRHLWAKKHEHSSIHVNSYKNVPLAKEYFNNQEYKITILWIPVNLYFWSPLLLHTEVMNKVGVEAGI